MKVKALFSLVLVAATACLILFSCEKEYKDRYCNDAPKVICDFDTSMVNVRIWNKTGYPLCNVRMKYQTNTTDTFNYGTMDIEEVSCYVKLVNSKVFPRVHFNLGTGKFTIPDSLTVNSKPYNTLLEKGSGFYTYYIFLAGPLDSLLTFPTMVFDEQ